MHWVSEAATRPALPRLSFSRGDESSCVRAQPTLAPRGHLARAWGGASVQLRPRPSPGRCWESSQGGGVALLTGLLERDRRCGPSLMTLAKAGRPGPPPQGPRLRSGKPRASGRASCCSRTFRDSSASAQDREKQASLREMLKVTGTHGLERRR